MTIMGMAKGMEKNMVERRLRRWARDEVRSGTKKNEIARKCILADPAASMLYICIGTQEFGLMLHG
jgi:hypothetical protein